MPVQFLTDAEKERLSSFPSEIEYDDIIKYFTLSPADMEQIPIRSTASNKLGFAFQLCAMRYLGFCPDDINETPPAIISYIAQQLDIDSERLSEYGSRSQTKSDQLMEIQIYLGFRKATPIDMQLLEKWLLERALEHDKPTFLLQLACEKLFIDKIVRPGITILERLVSKIRNEARTVTAQHLGHLLTNDMKAFLDGLLRPDDITKRTTLFWLSKRGTSNSADEIIEALKKISFLLNANIDKWNLSNINPNRIKILAQIGKRATNQYLQNTRDDYRYSILISTLKQLLIDITDEAIDMYDQALWGYHNDAKKDLERFQKAASRAINQNLKVFQEIGEILTNLDIEDLAVRPVSFKRIPLEYLNDILERNKKIIRPDNDGCLDFFANKYGYIRRFAPKFISTFSFHSNIANDSMIEAIEYLRELNEKRIRPKILKDAPAEIIPKSWNSSVFDKRGYIIRRYYELCVLWQLREAFRASNIWVHNSRRYANPETYLIPPTKWSELKIDVCSMIKAPLDGNIRLQEREIELARLIPKVEKLLLSNSHLRMENNKIVVTPFTEETRPLSAIQLEDEISKRLPQVELSELIIEVDRWTGFSNYFEHASGLKSKSPDIVTHLYACILAQACNFGLDQMAQSSDIPYSRLAWCNTWYIRDDTLKNAMNTIVNYHHKLPLAKFWGSGTLSSSDGQRFPVAGKVRKATSLPRYFGYGKGLTFYSWSSDQFSQFGTKVIPATVRDATHVLDEILNNETELPIVEHTTDTAGYTELVFALFDLLGLKFSPRIRDIGRQYLYRMDSIDINKYKNLKHHFKGIINRERILNRWDDLLRLTASLKMGWVSASLLIQRLQELPRKNELTKSLQEYGRIPKTIFILKWYESQEFQRYIQRQLNKGEALNALQSYLRFANKGYIKRKHDEDLSNQASCLNLVTNIVILWNTVYMMAVIEQLKTEGYNVNENDIKHLWPTRYKHINVHGKYRFNIEETLMLDGLRPLREPGIM